MSFDHHSIAIGPIPQPPHALLEWSQIIAGFGSIVLTILLVVLYKKQQEQLIANHEAILEVSGCEWDEDEVTAYISNYGNGVARGVSLRTYMWADNGRHRYHTLKTFPLKRNDKKGENSSIIEPGEEEIKFTGESKIGYYYPPHGFVGVNASRVIKKLKKTGTTEARYQHFIVGQALSGRECLDSVQRHAISFSPQKIGKKTSIGEIPNKRLYLAKNPFAKSIYPSQAKIFTAKIYLYMISAANWILPRYRIEPRPIDVYGRKRVKRVHLKYVFTSKIRDAYEALKSIYY